MTVRKKRYSIFVFGEGSREKAFFEHLKEIYQPEINQRNKAVTVDAGTGSAPKVILEDAIRVASTGEFRERFVILDVDGAPALTDKDRERAQQEGFSVIESVPICFDCMLLKAKTGSFETDCGRCKSKLAALVAKPTDSNSYRTNFGRDFLDSYSDKNPGEPLARLVKIFRK